MGKRGVGMWRDLRVGQNKSQMCAVSLKAMDSKKQRDFMGPSSATYMVR